MDHHNALQVQHPPQPHHFQSYAPQASSSFHEYMPPAPHHPHHQFDQSQEFGSSGPRSLSQHEEEMLAHLDRLKFFLATAPSRWAASAASNSASDPHFSYQDPSSSGNNVPPVPHPALNRFLLPSGEYVSCVLWNGLYHITGTDIVRALVFRFDAFGRPVRNMKKFEEGVFSDLRNLKPGTDACLEEPKSPFLDLLFKYQCIRTQKKQKVFYWFSVPHDRLFLDALERDLKREKMGQEPTTVIVGEPARSFTYDPKRTLFEQFSKARGGIEGEGELERAVREIGEVPEPGAATCPTPPFTNPSLPDMDTRAVAAKTGSPGGSENDDHHYAQSLQHPSRPLLHPQQSSSDSFVGSSGSDKPAPDQAKGPGGAGTPFFSMFSLFEGSPNYKQRRKKAAATTGTTGPAGSLAGAKQPTSGLATADVITGSHLDTSESPLAVNSNIYGNDVGYGDSYDTSTEVQHSQSYLSDVGATADQYTPPQQYPSSSYSLAPSASHGSTTGAHVGLGLGMAPPATDYRHSSPFAPQPVSHHYHPQHPMSQVHNLSPSPVPMGLGPSPEIISSTGMPIQQQHFVQVNGTMSPMHNMGHTAQSPAPPHPSHGIVSASPGMASGVGHFSQSPAPHLEHPAVAYVRHAASSPAPIHDHTGYGVASALPSSTFAPSTPMNIQSASLPATSSPMNMGTPGAGAGLPGSTPVPRLKQFPCPLYSCGKTFKRMEHLKRHLRTHTMERPFACDKCGKKFSRSDNLTQHLRTHSKDSGELSIKDGGDFDGSGGENDGSGGDESDGMGLGEIDLEQDDVVGVVNARVPMTVFDGAGQVHNSPTPFTNNLPPSSSLDTWAGPSSHGHTGDYIPPHSQSLPVPITSHAESRASFSALHPVEGSPLQYGSPQQVPGALLPAHEQHAIHNHAQQLLSRSNRPRPMHTVTSDGYSVPYPRGASLQPPTMRSRPDFASFGGDALSSSAPSVKAGYENLALLPGYTQSSSFHGSVGPIRRHRSATPTIRPGSVPQFGSPGPSLFALRTQASHGYHPYLHRQSRSRDFSTSSSLGMGAQDDASQGVQPAAGDYGGVLDSTSLADASVNAQVGGSAEFYSVPSVDSVGVVDNASLYGLDGPSLVAPEGSPSGFLGTPDAQQIGV